MIGQLWRIMRQLSEVALDCGNTHPTARGAWLGSIHGTEGTSPLDKFVPRSRPLLFPDMSSAHPFSTAYRDMIGITAHPEVTPKRV